MWKLVWMWEKATLWLIMIIYRSENTNKRKSIGHSSATLVCPFLSHNCPSLNHNLRKCISLLSCWHDYAELRQKCRFWREHFSLPDHQFRCDAPGMTPTAGTCASLRRIADASLRRYAGDSDGLLGGTEALLARRVRLRCRRQFKQRRSIGEQLNRIKEMKKSAINIYS